MRSTNQNSMAAKPNSLSTKTACASGQNEKALALVVWHQLTEYFGTKFTEGHGDEPPGSWVRECAKLGADGVDRALARLLADEQREWPPTLPEFIGLAAPANRRGMTTEQRAMYSRVRREDEAPTTTALPPSRSPEEAQRTLSELRKKLSSNSPDCRTATPSAPAEESGADIVACHKCGVGTVEGDVNRVVEYGLGMYARPGLLVDGWLLCEPCAEAAAAKAAAQRVCQVCQADFTALSPSDDMCEKCHRAGW